MTGNIISNKTIKEELDNYFNAIKMKRTSAIIYIISTIIVLSLTIVTLLFIYIFPEEYVGIFNPHNHNEGTGNV
jgi:flagellar basal body-associated protein FliL